MQEEKEGTMDERYAGESGQFTSLNNEDGQQGPQKSIEGWIVFVTGIQEEAQEDNVFDHFSQYGQLKNLHLNLDRRTGYVKGYLLIEFEEFQEAQNCIDAHKKGLLFLGKVIKVDWAFVKPIQQTSNTKQQSRGYGRKK